MKEPPCWVSSPRGPELVKLSPAKRQARFYRLEIWPDLFGGRRRDLPCNEGS